MTALRRLPPDRYDDTNAPRYFHPNGYVLIKCKRSWDERVGARRGQATAGPMYWWEIHRHLGDEYSVEGFSADYRYLFGAEFTRAETDCIKLRDARAWCDEHPRKGWNVKAGERQ